MSEFVEVKTSELTGAALDWAVGVAEGNPMRVPVSDVVWSDHHGSYAPSIDWAQGGPLIERYRIQIAPVRRRQWLAMHEAGDFLSGSPLVSICRAIVAAKLGDVVQVPASLTT